MIPLVLVGGFLGAIALLLTAKKPAKEQNQEKVTNAQALSNLSRLQQEQINKFTTVAGIAGAAVTSTLATLGVGAATAGPVGAAVAAAIVAIGTFRGTAHLAANELVQNIQNPFGKALSAIVDAKDASISAGSATQRSVQQAKLAVERLYAQYRNYAEEYAAQGSDQRKVVNQSYNKLNPIITRIINDMDAQIGTLPY